MKEIVKADDVVVLMSKEGGPVSTVSLSDAIAAVQAAVVDYTDTSAITDADQGAFDAATAKLTASTAVKTASRDALNASLVTLAAACIASEIPTS